MKINRRELIRAYNPVKTSIDVSSPLTVGNGEFAFTCDVTGLQTLYQLHKDNHMPLCTMSQWGWHHTPNKAGAYYTLEDLVMTEYDAGTRTVRYPVEKKAGNEEVYDWLRQNPHRLNLGRFYFEYDGQAIEAEQLSDIDQTLELYTGCIRSRFTIEHMPVSVETICHGEQDALGFRIASGALADKRLVFKMAFPYGLHDITASDWESAGAHTTVVQKISDKAHLIERRLDREAYFVSVHASHPVSVTQEGHILTIDCGQPVLDLTVCFAPENKFEALTFDDIAASSKDNLRNYWENGAMIDISAGEGNAAAELQRRIILSLYLIYIQACGSMPPQETGLTCNSWYGKFHLEMHPLHQAFLPLWGRGRYLLKSLSWYQKALPKARENAARNGYKGARWPKMVAYDAVDAPSVIAPLLIWQQPHLLYMLELLYTEFNTADFLRDYWALVRETAEFMCDFPVYDEVRGVYDLCPPMIPAQEEHRPMDTVNPVFELAYWHFGLTIAIEWAKRLNQPYEIYLAVRDKLTPLPVIDGCYPAHAHCTDTFTAYNKDHPSMLFITGYLPGEKADPSVVLNTYKKVMAHWQFDTMWGWDFALMAMTMTRLGKPEEAMSILLKDTAKNTYVASGNNYQKLREDLPLYLPGNGSLLLAVALMAAGCKDAPREHPGFPEDYTVIAEDFLTFPF